MTYDMAELLDIVNAHIEIFTAPTDGAGRTANYLKVNGDMNTLRDVYGFVSDHGRDFSDKYYGGRLLPMNDADALRALLSESVDVNELGSFYVSYWDEVTVYMDYSSNADPFAKKRAELYLVVLEALKRLIVAELT